MNRKQLKQQVEEILAKDFTSRKKELLAFDLKSLLNPLFSMLCSPNEQIRWNAVLAFGLVVPKIAENNMEDGRIVMRRFLWSLNDESGGIGWGAPEAMAAVMAESEALRLEYFHMLLSYMEDDGDELFEDGNYLELPMLQRGLLWGVSLLCHRFPELLDERMKKNLISYLDSEDLQVAGLALWALAGSDFQFSQRHLNRFTHSSEIVEIFSEDKILYYQISDLFEVVGA